MLRHHHHFLLVIYPAQGHINPSLHFAKQLIDLGAHVTFSTTIHMQRRMNNKPTPTIPGLFFAPFSDGYDGGFIPTPDSTDHLTLYPSELKRRGTEFVTNLILSTAQEGHRPFTCLLYTLLLPWAAEVARGFHIPATLLWVQSATVFDIFYYYFNGYRDYINNKTEETKQPSSCSLELPGLPFLAAPCDLPSFLSASSSNVNSSFLSMFEEQFHELCQETNPIVLVNTFEALETEALRAVEKFNMIPIGPLIPSDSTSFSSDDYVEWLNSKPELSVVYVSFGSLCVLTKTQMEQIARALLDYGKPFMWVIREKEDELSCMEELRKMGKIVKWCSQLEVLSHASLGCFVTHCGWNSTIESLVCGVPVVAFPQWLDQKTNAKLIADVWKIGVRVDHVVNEEGVVQSEEIRRCLEVVMGSGEEGEELRRSVKKWKVLAREAVKEGGSSEKNMRAFLDEL